MSRSRPDPTCLGLDAQRLARAGVPAQAWPSDGLAPLLHAADGAPAPRRLMLGSDLCRHFVYRAPAGLRSLAELRALAAARAQQLFGDGAWTVCADWSLAHPFVCAALPTALLDTATRGRPALRVDSSVLVALAALMRQLRTPGFIAWTTPASVLVAHTDAAGRVDALRCVARPVDLTADGLVDLVAREAVQESLRSEGDSVASTWLAWTGLQALPADSAALDGRIALKRFDARDVLPLSASDDTEADWAARLGALH